MHIITTYENLALLDTTQAGAVHRLVDNAVADTEWEVSGLALDGDTVLCAIGLNLDTRRSFMSSAWRSPFLADLIVHKGGHHVALCFQNGARLALITLG